MNYIHGYISYEDFISRFEAELINLSSADSILEDDAHVIKKLIIDSTYEMNLDIGKLYDTKALLEMRHPQLKRMCADLTWFYLLKRKGVAEHRDKELYYDSVKIDLSEIGKGKKVLEGVTPKHKLYNNNTVSFLKYEYDNFTLDTMGNWEDLY